MALHAVLYRYSTDSAALDEHRPAHKDHLRSLFEQGRIVVSGPLTSGGPGALLILDAEDPEEVARPAGQGPVPRPRPDRRAGDPAVEPGLRRSPPRHLTPE